MGTPAGEMHCSFLPCSGFLAKEAVSSVQWDCVKSLLPPAAAEYSSERHVIFTISRSEIVKMSNYLAGRALGNNILACVHFLRAEARKK